MKGGRDRRMECLISCRTLILGWDNVREECFSIRCSACLHLNTHGGHAKCIPD